MAIILFKKMVKKYKSIFRIESLMNDYIFSDL